MIRHVLTRALYERASVSTLAAKDWYVALVHARTRWWQCDIPRVSDPTLRSVTRTRVYTTRTFVVLASRIETNERKPGHSNARTLPSDRVERKGVSSSPREKMKNRPENGEQGIWIGNVTRMHPVTLPGRRFWKISIRRETPRKPFPRETGTA